jgi:hypothetical protein
LNTGEVGPVLTGGGVVVFGALFGAVLGAAADDGGLRSPLVALPVALAVGAAGAAAPLSVPEPIRSPSSDGWADVPRVRMNANTATIAAPATTAAPMALCERCARRGRAALRLALVCCCLRAARAGGFR